MEELQSYSTFFNFGFHLFISGRNLYLSNHENHNDILNIELPIEETDMFNVVKYNFLLSSQVYHFEVSIDLLILC